MNKTSEPILNLALFFTHRKSITITKFDKMVLLKFQGAFKKLLVTTVCEYGSDIILSGAMLNDDCLYWRYWHKKTCVHKNSYTRLTSMNNTKRPNTCLYQKSTDTPSPFSNTSPTHTVQYSTLHSYNHTLQSLQIQTAIVKDASFNKKNFSTDRMILFNNAVTC